MIDVCGAVTDSCVQRPGGDIGKSLVTESSLETKQWTLQNRILESLDNISSISSKIT